MVSAGRKGGKKKKDLSDQFSETGFRKMKQDDNAFVTGFDLFSEDEKVSA